MPSRQRPKVMLSHTGPHQAIFMFYADGKRTYTLIREEPHRALLEDDDGRRDWVDISIVRVQP